MNWLAILILKNIIEVVTLFWLILIFTYNEHIWIKSNKIYYGLLCCSIIFLVGDAVDVFKINNIKRASLYYSVCLTIVSSFILYWITIGRVEKRKREIHAYYTINFFLEYFSIVSLFYLRKEFRESRERAKGTQIGIADMEIGLPAEQIFKILKQSQYIKNDIKKEYKRLREKKERRKNEYLNYALEISKISNKKIEKNYKDEYGHIEEIYNSKIYVDELYKIIKEKKKNYERIIDIYSTGDIYEEIETIKDILKYNEELLGENSKLITFIDNLGGIEEKILEIIKRNIQVLKCGDRHIPEIIISLNLLNFGKLDQDLIFEIIERYNFKPKVLHEVKFRKNYQIKNYKKEEEDIIFYLKTGKKIKMSELGRKIIIDYKGIYINAID